MKIICLLTIICFFVIACNGQRDDITDNDEKSENIIGTILDKACYDISMYSDGTNIYISYYDDYGNNLKVAKSTNKGLDWELQLVDSISNADYDITYKSNINYYNDAIEILYNLVILNDNKMKYAKKANDDQDWSTTQIIGEDSFAYDNPVFARDNSNMYIAFAELGISRRDIKFMKSSNNGVSWTTTTVDVSEDTTNPSISVDNNMVYLAYCDVNNYDLKFAKSDNTGDTWEKGILDSSGDVGYVPSILSDNNEVYIVYMGDRSLKIAISLDHGESWSFTTIDEEKCWHPQIILSDNELLVVYTSYFSLKILRSTDKGQSWESKTITSTNAQGLEKPVIYKNGNDIFISYLLSINDKMNLMFLKSDDNGITWN